MNRDQMPRQGSMGIRTGFKISTRMPSGERGYIVQSSENDFMYDAVDADLRIEIDGKPAFPPGSYRVSDEGFLQSIPILVFVSRLVVACEELSRSDPATQRVSVTSTNYVLEFNRRSDSVRASVLIEERGSSKTLAEVSLSFALLRHECKSLVKLQVASILSENPGLAGNLQIGRLLSAAEKLDRYAS